ncbi:transposase [Anaerotalea alkaliphila]|uniref:Transposase n=1 Tax=Anaerotalea alkaliphila TaxID=2662126 RepID=A0A7X5HXE6_9FIRM|nr:transposase [Anaerotalea alkaliphila]NDL68407.1 transposase [Anaerotalea alkaliphila]
MPRRAREKSVTGIYHVMWRGNNKQTVFQDSQDCRHFLKILEEYRHKCGFTLYAYCLMGNHVHLLMKEGEEPLGRVFCRIGAKLVFWHNRKYKRVGHLFQDRYRSEAVDNDAYLLTVLRYIHRNPVKAGMVEAVADYPWSSYGEYIRGGGICDTGSMLRFFGEDGEKAVETFRSFHQAGDGDRCQLEEELIRLDDREAEGILREMVGVERLEEFGKWKKEERDRFLRLLKGRGLTARQIAGLLKIGTSTVKRA